MTRYLMPVWLVVLWVVLWRDLTIANIVGGAIIAAVLLLLYPLQAPDAPNFLVRFGRVIRFFGYMLWLVASSNIILARAVLSPRSRINTGILAFPMPHCPNVVVTLVTNILALTPGTLPNRVSGSPRTIYVHILHTHDINEVRLQVQKLIRKALGTMLTDAALAAYDRDIAASSPTALETDIGESA